MDSAAVSMDGDVANLISCVRALTSNKDFTSQLSDERVQRMLLHWTNKDRMDHEQADELGNDILVKTVFKEMRQLQHLCKQVGIAVPLDMTKDKIELSSPEAVAALLTKIGKLQPPEPAVSSESVEAVTETNNGGFTLWSYFQQQGRVMLWQLIILGMFYIYMKQSRAGLGVEDEAAKSSDSIGAEL